jgi:prolipoprotein diacylglyceryl transferase
MKLVLFLPALLLFLYILYRMVKDDYVFIRKGISLEQSFDIAFVTLWTSLFFSRFFYLLFHMPFGTNIIWEFFSFQHGGFSLTGAIVGGALALILMGRDKRIPLARISDFLSLSLLYTLPLAFLTNALLVSKNELLLVFLNTIIYFVLLIFTVQFLYPKLMSRTLKEGFLAIFFLLAFSSISLATSVLLSLRNIYHALTPENGMLLIIFIISCVLAIKQQKGSGHTRRSVVR